MILNNKQEEGLKIAVARYKAHEPWTCIAGVLEKDQFNI